MLVPILLTMTIGFAGFAVYIDSAEFDNRLSNIDDELSRAARRPTVVDSRPGDPEPLPGVQGDAESVEVPLQLTVSASGEPLRSGGARNPFTATELAELADAARSSPEGARRTVDPIRVRALASVNRNGDISITALSLEELDSAMADLRRTLLVAGVVIGLLQAAVVWLVTTVVVRPVTRMTLTATQVADGSLDTWVEPPSGAREVAALATDLDRMLVRLRDTIERSEESAAEAQRARDDMQRFVADVSHEFRTPLTALRGYSDLYAGGMLEEEGALDRAMDRVGNETNRLHALVTDMLDLTKGVQPGEVHEPVDLASVARDVVDDLRSAHAPRAIGLSVPDDPALVLGVGGPIHQAVLNVVANACQHTPVDTGVDVRVSNIGATVVVDVVDHGDGVPAGDVDNIWLPFFRGDASRSRRDGGGAGLGLSVASRHVERFGATMDVAETSGGGSTFTLSFPAARDRGA